MKNIPRIGAFLSCFLCSAAWPQSSLDSLVASAEQFESDGQWENAATVYQQILKIDPVSIPALNRLGAIRVGRGEYRKGIELYERAYKLNPREFVTNLNLGIAFIKMQDDRSALAPLTRAVSTGPDQPQPRELLGVALIAQDDYTHAIPHSKKYWCSTRTILELSICTRAYLQTGQFDQALRTSEWLKILAPDFIWVHILRGQAYDGRGENEKAVGDLRPPGSHS